MTMPQLPLEPPRRAESAPPEVQIRRSARRRRTVSARMEAGRIIVMVPERLSAREEARLVAEMVAKVQAQQQRSALSDEELMVRAEQLSATYLGGRARPTSIRWVSNQRSRWGSCTPKTGVIRISSRLGGMPREVVDYVVLHELAHLLVPRHGKAFWALLESYPHLERARGFLDGVSYADGVGSPDSSPPSAD